MIADGVRRIGNGTINAEVRAMDRPLYAPGLWSTLVATPLGWEPCPGWRSRISSTR